MKLVPFKTSALVAAIGLTIAGTQATANELKLEEVVVVAEKRSESLQDLSQAVTAITSDELDQKNINSFIDISAIAPGVNIAKNEGFKTVITIRGVGNEANQNAVANPSVSYHLDGIYVASPFAIQADFIDVERIEALRGPQGTLFGQNSTGGAINVISKAPSTEDIEGKADLTVGEYDLLKVRGSINLPITDSIATRTSFSKIEQDGFTDNIINGQDLDDTNNISVRTDWKFDVSDTLSLRAFGQYFEEDSNGAAIKGIDDPTADERKLAQDTTAKYELESKIAAAIVEWDAGFATVKALASWQEDEILIVRDNDRHSYQLNPEITRSEFNPEINIQETTTLELNVISNEPLFGSVDWIVGAFYLDTDIDITIREELDLNPVNFDPNLAFNGILDGYETTPGAPGERGFISDSNPTRESLSFYGQTTWSITDRTRLITGLRYTEDEVESQVSNFFVLPAQQLKANSDAVTGRLALEYDVSDSAMAYASYTKGFKPGGTNLTFGTPEGILNDGSIDSSPALVTENYEDETINAYELGLKSEFFDGRVRANLAVFFYDYENLQFQATDPDPFQGGVANIPKTEIYGAELELSALLSESFTLDMNLATLDGEVTGSFEALDNVKAEGSFDDFARYNLREDINGNELAKSPGLTADISLRYNTVFDSGTEFMGSIQYTYRGDFEQRVFNNPDVDQVDSYEVVNLVTSLDFAENTWGLDLMAMNIFDEDGVNSRMTDVFGVSQTGEELISPRQVMARVRYQF
jgi:iron complex outermembrane receptor protein